MSDLLQTKKTVRMARIIAIHCAHLGDDLPVSGDTPDIKGLWPMATSGTI